VNVYVRPSLETRGQPTAACGTTTGNPSGRAVERTSYSFKQLASRSSPCATSSAGSVEATTPTIRSTDLARDRESAAAQGPEPAANAADTATKIAILLVLPQTSTVGVRLER
jgi:hypothetical protein